MTDWVLSIPPLTACRRDLRTTPIRPCGCPAGSPAIALAPSPGENVFTMLSLFVFQSHISSSTPRAPPYALHLPYKNTGTPFQLSGPFLVLNFCKTWSPCPLRCQPSFYPNHFKHQHLVKAFPEIPGQNTSMPAIPEPPQRIHWPL